MQRALPDLPRRFERLQRCGWYLRTLTAGRVPVAGPIVVVERDDAAISVVIAPRAARWDGGLADACSVVAIPVFGPTAAAGRVESSKEFAKRLMDGAGIPTARWRAGGVEQRDTL